MEVCNYLGIPKVNICTPSVSALQIFDHEKQSSIASNFHRHRYDVTITSLFLQVLRHDTKYLVLVSHQLVQSILVSPLKPFRSMNLSILKISTLNLS